MKANEERIFIEVIWAMYALRVIRSEEFDRINHISWMRVER